MLSKSKLTIRAEIPIALCVALSQTGDIASDFLQGDQVFRGQLMALPLHLGPADGCLHV